MLNGGTMTAVEYTEDFERLWKAYPARNGRKNGKKPAFVQWKKLTADEKRAAFADVEKRNRLYGWGKYIKDCERYLRHMGWHDEWQPESPATPSGPVRRSPTNFHAPALPANQIIANKVLLAVLRNAGGVDRLTLNNLVALKSAILEDHIGEKPTPALIDDLVDQLAAMAANKDRTAQAEEREDDRLQFCIQRGLTARGRA